MGRKGNWFSSVKKVLSPESKRSKEKRLLGNGKSIVEENSKPREIPPLEHRSPPTLEEMKFTEVVDDDEEPTVVDADFTSQATTEVVHVTKEVQFPRRSKEEVAAIRIQTALRGYLARRALRSIRGLVRLKSLVGGPTIKRQTGHALKCMQTLARVQARIQSTRIKILEENQALERQLLQKRAKEESLQLGEDWDVSLQSKEQIEANLLNKYEATMRRERALAYAYSHQQNGKKSARPAMLIFMDPNNPHWGWTWLERWTEAHPSEEKIEAIGERHHHQLDNNNSEKPSPVSNNQLKPKGRKLKLNDDSKSSFSIRLDKNRRHSVSGSVVRKDDESLSSSPFVPSYMVSTKSTKAKSRMQNPLGLENGSKTSTKKRLSFPAPVKARRLSGPPRIETNVNVVA
ncbi:protein IQ-DOMAIN 2-like [Impatiens glandulifera]|uniref:protein IQ-DOMAIN 2-like n=1 Tax=Impatiens glandulifera TaxID=253017 RepID=UPI001FB17864|nr:protein IQ-DOMAIN 2-like [Impatiens glandulifera]